MKSQLNFKDTIVLGRSVSIAVCPIQGMSFTAGTDDSRQANDNCVMPCIAKIKSPVCHIDFQVALENYPYFSFWASMASNTFLDLFFNQYLAPSKKRGA